jgi:hypothetical protein
MVAARLVANPQVVMTELGDGTGVLLHLDTKFYYSLNGTGVFVWKTVAASAARGAAADEIVDAMIAGFEVDRATAERDVGELLAEFGAEGLVVVAAVAASVVAAGG